MKIILSLVLLFAQFRMPPSTIWLKQQQFALIVIILYISFTYTITILQQRSSNHNYSLHTEHDIHTRLTEFFLNPVVCFFFAFYIATKQSNESTWRRSCLLLIFVLFWCCLFTSLLFFYTDVVAIFLSIRRSCKQAQKFCFWSFRLSF